MIETIIVLLIYICLIVGAVYLVEWVLTSLGVAIPPKVMKVIWVVVVLVILLLVFRAFGHLLPAL